MSKESDEQALRERLERISEMFSGLAAKAETISQTRCPYRNRFDHCTAQFRCRNQQPRTDSASTDPAPLCSHDGSFDYRSAWESNPRAYQRAKSRIRETKRQAEQQRRDDGDPPK